MNKKMTREERQHAINTPVTTTPQQLADKLHNEIYKNQEAHCEFHSCPCYHLALFYLGVTDSHGLYWPDGEGGNVWKVTEAGKQV